jgi:hypothetical protein
MTKTNKIQVVLVKAGRSQLFRCLWCQAIVTGGYNVRTSEFVSENGCDIQCPACYQDDGLQPVETYSVEAGIHDGLRHFDHHGAHSANPAPCNNPRIMPWVKVEGGIIQMSHIDADTLVGIKRLLGLELPDSWVAGPGCDKNCPPEYEIHNSGCFCCAAGKRLVDLTIMEELDLNGSSILGDDHFNSTRMWMVGVSDVTRELKFPRLTDQIQDITDLINQLLSVSDEDLIGRGKIATIKSDNTFDECIIAEKQIGETKIGLWFIGANDPMDPSRPYSDNFDVVVIYRSHFKSCSIYINPNHTILSNVIGDWAGIAFEGHKKAAGSPRGAEITPKEAISIYEAIASYIENEKLIKEESWKEGWFYSFQEENEL